jgi:hypothetical protein
MNLFRSVFQESPDLLNVAMNVTNYDCHDSFSYSVGDNVHVREVE